MRRSLAVLLSGLVCVGCTAKDLPLGVKSVTLTAPADGTSFVSLGVIRQVIAAADTTKGSQNTAAGFTWTSSAPDVVSVDNTGMVTSVGNGTATITASIGELSGTLTFTVAQVAKTIAIDPASATIQPGDTKQFTLTARDANGRSATTDGVVWSVDATSIATVDSSGLVTAQSAGTAMVTARLGSLQAAAQLTVNPAVPATVTVTGAEQISSVGGTTQLTAVAKDARSMPIPDATVTWSSAAEAVATVSAGGLVTAVSNGSSVITAHVGSVTGTLTITIQQVVATVEVSPETALTRPSRTQQFTVVVKDALGSVVAGAPVATWSSSNPAVAQIDANGLATTGAVTQLATSTITATVNSVSDSATLTVDPDFLDIQSVAVTGGGNAPDLTALGDTLQLTAAATDSINQAVANATFTWQSSNEACATVDSSGQVTAVGNGVTTITVSAGGHSATTTITVQQALDSIEVTTANAGDPLTLASLGQSLQLIAHGLDANEHPIPGLTFSWASNDGSVTVNQDGLATSVTNGSAIITATSGMISGTVTLVVTQAIASISVSGGSTPITLHSIDEEVTLTAQAKDARGNAISGVFTWQVDLSAVASVDSTGVVTARGNGSTLVHATSAGVSGSILVTVSQVVAEVELTASGTTQLQNLGDFAPVTATARDANGHAVAGIQFSWSASDSSVVLHVDAGTDTARVEAIANNAGATITVTFGDFSDTLVVNVQQVTSTIDVAATEQTSTLSSLGAVMHLNGTRKDARANDIPGGTFTWSSSDPSVATIDQGGILTAVGNGQTTLTAHADNIDGTFVVTVYQLVASVAVTPENQVVAPGQTIQFSAQPLDANGHPLERAYSAAWDTSSPVVTIDENGLATTNATAVPETVSITATIEEVVGSTNLIDDPSAIVVGRVEIADGASTSFGALGETTQLSATVYDDSDNPAVVIVTWSSSDLTVVTVDQTGLVTAVGNGTATITASAGNKIDTLEFNVSQQIASVSVSATAATLASFGQTLSLTAIARDARDHAINGAVFTWGTANAGVATVNGSGLVTAVGDGSVSISATSGAFSDAITINVQQAVAIITLSTTSVSFGSLGESTTLSATPKDARGNVMAAAVVWSSEDEDVAVVADGEVTAVANGNTRVHAKAGVIDASASVTVSQVVQSVVLTGPGTLDSLGASLTLTAVALDTRSNAIPSASFAWSAEDGTVLVTPAGDTRTAQVTAVANNSGVFVHATSGTKDAQALVTVAQVPTDITLTPSAPTALTSLGQTLHLAAIQKDARGNAIVDRDTLSWNVDDTAVGTISADGDSFGATFTGVDNGTAHVSVSDGTNSTSATVSVAQAVASLAISAGGSTNLPTVGSTVQLSATAKDALGSTVSGAPVTWSSSNMAVATVDSDGLVTAAGPGSATIRASSGSAAATMIVNAIVASIVVTPNPAIVVAGGTIQLGAQAKDAMSNNLSGLAMTWSSMNTALATVSTTGLVSTLMPSPFTGASGTINATTAGVTGSTELFVAVSQPFIFSNTGGSGFTVTVSQDQYIVFKNTDGVPHSIVWDTAGAPSNIGTFNGGTSASPLKATQAAGEYHFHCGIHGTSMKGTLRIQ